MSWNMTGRAQKRPIMSKSRKRTCRGAHYRALAEGYEMLKSPLAGSFYRAAEHYDQTDPPVAAPAATKDAEIEEERFGTQVA
jgi:hypothetical protein